MRAKLANWWSSPLRITRSLLSPFPNYSPLQPESGAGWLDTSWEEMPNCNIPALEDQAGVEKRPENRGYKQMDETWCSPETRGQGLPMIHRAWLSIRGVSVPKGTLGCHNWGRRSSYYNLVSRGQGSYKA